MLEAMKQLNRKRNIVGRGLEVMIDQQWQKKGHYFGGFSSGFSNEMKRVKWQKGTEAANAASSELRTLDELEKKKQLKNNFKREAERSTHSPRSLRLMSRHHHRPDHQYDPWTLCAHIFESVTIYWVSAGLTELAFCCTGISTDLAKSVSHSSKC